MCFFLLLYYFIQVLERKKLVAKFFKRNGSFLPISPNNAICTKQKTKGIQIFLIPKNNIKYSANVRNKKLSGKPNICLFSDTDLYICAEPSMIDGSLKSAILFSSLF